MYLLAATYVQMSLNERIPLVTINRSAFRFIPLAISFTLFVTTSKKKPHLGYICNYNKSTIVNNQEFSTNGQKYRDCMWTTPSILLYIGLENYNQLKYNLDNMLITAFDAYMMQR